MGNHSVQRSGEAFTVTDKDGQVLHTFPSEGEANLQVVALDEAEKAKKAEAKAEAKEAKAEEPEPRHEVKASGRHR